MGQHPVYNRVIKSKGETKMTHRELQTMLKQLSEYQKNQISQTIQRFLALNQELTEIEPDTCPCCGDQNAVFIIFLVTCHGVISASRPVRSSKWHG